MIDRLAIASLGIVLPGGDSPRARTAYEQAVEQFFGCGKAFAFWKGRIALYAILKALDLRPGDEVLVPGYTCVMVPGPVIYAGGRPVYVDIDAKTYNIRPEEVARKITPRTRAILVQHTYGIPAAVAEVKAIADARGIAVIEDCCHTFGGRLGGRPLGTFGTAAFFSGQWNKPFSTGLGGLALVHDEALARRVGQEQARYPVPSRGAAFMLASQLLVYELAVYPSTTAWATRAFRWLTKKGLVVGSANKAEFDVVMPEGYPLRPSPVQCRLGRREVTRAAANAQARSRVVARYVEALPSMGFSLPVLPEGWDPVMVRFPVRVANKDEALAKAVKYGIELGSWFECPLHPIETDQSAFGYHDGECPMGEKASREVVNLPTHRRVGPKTIEKTLRFLKEVCRPAET